MPEFVMHANAEQIIELKRHGYKEIVRCKECKYSCKIPPVGQRKCNGKVEKIVDDDFFCADGETADSVFFRR